MSKRLRVRDRLLLGLALLGDAYFEVAEPFSIQMKKMKGFLPLDYKATHFASSVSKMLRTGYMEKVIKDGEPYLRLAGKGKQTLVRDFPLFTWQNQRWDGKWRIVFYDIPEEMRKTRLRLQQQLMDLGFGKIQESVYLSPYDVAEDLREFVESENLEDYVFISVIKKLLAGNEKVLVGKVWHLEQTNEDYLSLSERFDKNEPIGELFAEYEDILRRDPCLPKELLPDNWMGIKVKTIIRKRLQEN